MSAHPQILQECPSLHSFAADKNSGLRFGQNGSLWFLQRQSQLSGYPDRILGNSITGRNGGILKPLILIPINWLENCYFRTFCCCNEFPVYTSNIVTS